jgi:hypothetical protein
MPTISNREVARPQGSGGGCASSKTLMPSRLCLFRSLEDEQIHPHGRRSGISSNKKWRSSRPRWNGEKGAGPAALVNHAKKRMTRRHRTQ